MSRFASRAAPWITAAAVACAAAPALAVPPGDDGRRLAEARAFVGDLELERADPIAAALLARHPDDLDVLDLGAELAFHRGAYDDAVRLATRAMGASAVARDRAARQARQDLYLRTRERVKSLVERRSPDGRYRVHVAARDADVLAPYALEVLARADVALSGALGHRHPGPIRLEILGSPADLAALSTLTQADIERTGTIALCKWDKLMVTSPGALARGYPWFDTIGHELVHLAVARATRDRTPVWLHEGLAKVLESRWRGPRPFALDPASQGLLQDAAKEGRLLPFERLHPSIARLPSQEDAALAFAQVATFVDGLLRDHGDEGLKQLLLALAEGTDARDAVARVAGETFDVLEARWKAIVSSAPANEVPPPRRLALRFKKGGTPERGEAEEVEDAVARKHVRLGDLLWGHDRPGAAATEYGKAHARIPDDPVVASRLATAALRAGRPADAATALRPLRDRYPTHAPLRARLGEALAALGSTEEARVELYDAIGLNPFDPAPHCALAPIAATAPEREREAVACRALSR